MRLLPFDYVEPKTLAQASKALARDPAGTVLLAGGTDLLVNMKHRLVTPARVINLKAIPKLAYISAADGGLRIGPLTTLDDLVSSPLVRTQYPALASAAEQAGAFTHQSMGTIAGSLCQGNRCRFYNQSESWRIAKSPCFKAGGEICYVVRKRDECHSTYCGDLAPILIALDAQVALVGPKGTRTVRVEQLYSQDGKSPLTLRAGEIVEAIVLPPPDGRAIYLKIRLRESIEFPLISLAVSVRTARTGRVSKIRVVFSGVGSGPVRTPAVETMLKGAPLSDQVIDQVARRVSKEISPLRTVMGSPAYKRRVSGALLKQALDTLRNEAV